MEIKICHLYSDVLNLCGDGGNVSCLYHRLKWRGIESSVTRLPIGDSRSLSDFDLVFIGGGQELGQQALLDDLRRGRGAEIKAAVTDGMVFLAISEGMELLGNYREGLKGERTEYIGAIDMYTKSFQQRFTGDYMFKMGEEDIIAFENHGGRTWLGQGVEPLGYVISGHGNNGEDGTEGVQKFNVFGSYGHGPLLAKNPALCDRILLRALERKYGAAELMPLDDSIELRAHETMYKRLGGGK